MKTFQRHSDKRERKSLYKRNALFSGSTGDKSYVFNMSSFAEFAIALNTVVEKFNNNNCYDFRRDRSCYWVIGSYNRSII
jgi:hypothetical protein